MQYLNQNDSFKFSLLFNSLFYLTYFEFKYEQKTTEINEKNIASKNAKLSY